MVREISILLLCSMGICAGSFGQADCDSIVYLNNGQATVGIQAFGGAITDFRLQGSALNPFTWALQPADMPPNNQQGAPFRGHFLCLGRWGAPTAGEMAAGMPHNGEAGTVCWQVMPGPHPRQMAMEAAAPRDGMQVRRTVHMDERSAVFKVMERVQSNAFIIRPFNMVQHATIGPPFLDTNTLIDCNAAEGFLQSMSYPNPHAFSYRWPAGIRDSLRRPLDLRHSADPFSYVTTHIFRDSIGWITALNPKSGMLIGYVWLVKDYPWVNIWQQWQGDRLWAKGLEFGTTGIGRPYQDLVAVDTRFHGVPSFVLLDAGESIEKSYLFFGLAVQPDFGGVEQLYLQPGRILLKERGGQGRTITINTSLSLKP